MSMTLSEAAEFLKCSKQNVCNLKRRGSIHRNEDGTYDQQDLEFFQKHHVRRYKPKMIEITNFEPVAPVESHEE